MEDTITEELAQMGIADTQPCGVIIFVAEYTDGVIDQKIILDEKSEDSEQNVFKYQWISDALLQALNGDNSVGSGGALREMGEGFQALMEEAGGDKEVAKQLFRENRKAHGQGKPKKER